MEVDSVRFHPARLTVGVVGEIDDDDGRLRVHFDVNLHLDAVGNAREWVVRHVDHAPAGLERRMASTILAD